MTDWQALVAAIKDKPADDVLRLVAADWLDDHGEPERAEFVRVQCKIREIVSALTDYSTAGANRRHALGLGGFDNTSELDALRRRESVLSAEHGDRWIAEISPALVGRCMWRWVRGFIDSVRAIDSADWLAHGDAILAAHPVRTVRLTDRPLVLATIGAGFNLPGRTFTLPGVRGLTVPWVGDGLDYSTVRPPTAEELFAAEWPGVAFELPAERQFQGVTMNARRIEVQGEWPGPLTSDFEMTDADRMVMEGNPNVGTPQGIINYHDYR